MNADSFSNSYKSNVNVTTCYSLKSLQCSIGADVTPVHSMLLSVTCDIILRNNNFNVGYFSNINHDTATDWKKNAMLSQGDCVMLQCLA